MTNIFNSLAFIRLKSFDFLIKRSWQSQKYSYFQHQNPNKILSQCTVKLIKMFYDKTFASFKTADCTYNSSSFITLEAFGGACVTIFTFFSHIDAVWEGKVLTSILQTKFIHRSAFEPDNLHVSRQFARNQLTKYVSYYLIRVRAKSLVVTLVPRVQSNLNFGPSKLRSMFVVVCVIRVG